MKGQRGVRRASWSVNFPAKSPESLTQQLIYPEQQTPCSGWIVIPYGQVLFWHLNLRFQNGSWMSIDGQNDDIEKTGKTA
jgi:hypothetical protein